MPKINTILYAVLAVWLVLTAMILKAENVRDQLLTDSRVEVDNISGAGCNESHNTEPWRTVETRIKVECFIEFKTGDTYQIVVGYYPSWTKAGEEKGRWMDSLESAIAYKLRPVKAVKK